MKRQYTVLPLLVLFMASCSTEMMEQEAPIKEEGDSSRITVLSACMQDASTKTGYTIDTENKKAVFKWLEGDQIDVVVNLGLTPKTYTEVQFGTTQEGPIADFDDSASATKLADLQDLYPGAALAPWAFYPSRTNPLAQEHNYGIEWLVDKNDLITVTIPTQLDYIEGNPLSVVPMLGQRDEAGKYSFSPMTAILSFTVSGLDAVMDFISISYPEDAASKAALNGGFTVNDDAIKQSTAMEGAGHSLQINFSGLEGEHTFYFPVPSGTLPAGLVLRCGQKGNEENQMVKTTKQPIVLKNGVITPCVSMAFAAQDQQWTNYATGTFKDDFLWTYNTGFQSPTTVPVTIQRSGLYPQKFRINNPYTVACANFDYTPYTLGVTKDDYFVFVVADDGTVTYPAFKSGVEDKVSNGFPMKLNNSGSNTKVVATFKSGDFYEIQFGTLYTKYDDASYKYTKNNPPVLHLVVDLPDETWTKVVDGTFIDEKVWSSGLQNWGSTSVPIELYQSDLFESRFRVPNPYLVAKDVFSYTTYVEGITGDDYLVFSIEDDDAVRFTSFRAGIENKSSDGFALKVWYPSDYGSYPTALAGNIVQSYRNDGLPAEVELYPIYVDVAAGTASTSNKYTDQKELRVKLSFPEPETWTDVATLQYQDDFLIKSIAGRSAGVHVPVTLQQSSQNDKHFRIANPYPALATAAGVTSGYIYSENADEYLYLNVDEEDKITFPEFRPGMGRTDWEISLCETSDWNSKSSTGMGEANSRVDSYGADGIPSVIRIYGVFHKVGEYNTGNRYSRVNDQYGDAPVLANSLPLDSWTSLGNGRIWDKLVWSCAGITEYVTAEFQQNDNYPKKFRISKPYPGENSGDWFVFDVSDPDTVKSDNYFVDHEVTASGKASYKPWIRNGVDYGYNYSDVLTWQENGLPAVIEIGPCYRTETWQGYDYEIGRDHEHLAIEIIFPGCHPYLHMNITPITAPVKRGAHINVAQLSLSSTDNSPQLQRVVVKISGGDLSKMAGVRLWQDNQDGWMDSDYWAPDANGIVTMDSFTKPTISGSINLNFWTNDDHMIGSAFNFDVQEVVVDGKSVELAKEADPPHLAGVVVNTGGDKISVRGYGGIAEETVTSFRIPALVTSNAGTLIAAYDIRYRSSRDLVADIDVGVKRSTDGGNTWSDIILAMDMDTYGYSVTDAESWEIAQKQNGIGDPTLLVDENTGRIFCFAIWAHGHLYDSDNRSLAYAGKGYEIDDTPQFMMVYSDDDGVTWSDPINITRQVKRYDWRATFQGPGRGITMSDGTLVIPIQHQEGDEAIMHGLYPLNSGIAYSTDHGLTWHTHEFACPVTSESAVAEVEPGKLLLSMRDETDSYLRRAYYTTDLGRSWKAHESNGLIYGNTCEAGMLHINAADNILGKDITLISNPTAASRSRMTIHASLDHGKTYPYDLLIDSGGSQYSCLTMIGDSTVGILYESSQGNIFFQAIPLTEIIK